jgi:hypothetical protein
MTDLRVPPLERLFRPSTTAAYLLIFKQLDNKLEEFVHIEVSIVLSPLFRVAKHETSLTLYFVSCYS